MDVIVTVQMLLFLLSCCCMITNNYYYYYCYYYICLTAFFQDNLGKPTPEKQNHSGKTNLDLLEQEIVSGSGISWAMCKSAPHLTHNHASTPPFSFLQAGCSSCCPTSSVKALKANKLNLIN